jgi:hypothetical protein
MHTFIAFLFLKRGSKEPKDAGPPAAGAGGGVSRLKKLAARRGGRDSLFPLLWLPAPKYKLNIKLR